MMMMMMLGGGGGGGGGDDDDDEDEVDREKEFSRLNVGREAFEGTAMITRWEGFQDVIRNILRKPYQ